jgi:flagellar protein FlaG
MIVEPITISVKTTPNPPPQAKVDRANGRPETEKAEPKPDDAARLTEKVADIQKNLQLNSNVDLDFSVNQDSGNVVITVRDESTGKVIREIPSEEMRNLASKIDSMAGLILDLKV